MLGIHWRQLGENFLIWMSIELVFSIMGIDDLVDYAEFRLGRQRWMFNAGLECISMVQSSPQRLDNFYPLNIARSPTFQPYF